MSADVSFGSIDRHILSGDSYSFGSGKKIVQSALIDELKLEKERLTEELKQLQGDKQFMEERLVRQLLHLEEQNNRLKKQVEESMQKYFEGKKHWQSTIRQMQSKQAEQVKKLSSEQSISSESRETSSSSTANDAIAKRLREMEIKISEKVAESKQNLVAKVVAESKVAKLERELQSLKNSGLNSNLSMMSQNESNGAGGVLDVAEEMQQLRASVADMEFALRKKSRECERLEKSQQNQLLLQEQLAGANSSLAAQEKLLHQLQQAGVDNKRYEEERAEWTKLFKSIMDDESADVSPVTVLNTLSAVQKKCSLLTKQLGDLEGCLTETRKQLLRSESKSQELASNKTASEEALLRLERQLGVETQRTRLYEGEVQNLRALLKTYDVEFNIGRPESGRMLTLKEELIQQLRQDLDACREQLQPLLLLQLNNSTAANTVVIKTESVEQSPSEEVAVLTAEKAALQQDLQTLQAVTGMDFIPGNTKVLHLVSNPSSRFAKHTASAVISSLPMDELRRLRLQNKQLLSELRNTNTNNATHILASNNDDSLMDVATAMNTTSGGVTSSSNHNNTTASMDTAKLNQRLKEMFKERITSFREAVYLLTGYKIDLFSADAGSSQTLPRLRLRSMYAEQPDDCLLFQMRGEVLELLDTEFASRLDSKFFTLLTRSNSVPAFHVGVV